MSDRTACETWGRQIKVRHCQHCPFNSNNFICNLTRAEARADLPSVLPIPMTLEKNLQEMPHWCPLKRYTVTVIQQTWCPEHPTLASEADRAAPANEEGGDEAMAEIAALESALTLERDKRKKAEAEVERLCNNMKAARQKAREIGEKAETARVVAAKGNEDESDGTGKQDRELTPLSPEAREARKPPPPEELVGALQDRVHIDVGRGRPGHTARTNMKECEEEDRISDSVHRAHNE